MKHEAYEKRFEIERSEGWRESLDTIPYVKIPDGTEVRIIPPFAGAIARLMLRRGDKTCSIYLDEFGVLGCWDGPYWEVYPYLDDVGRCDKGDVEELERMIRSSLGVD